VRYPAPQSQADPLVRCRCYASENILKHPPPLDLLDIGQSIRPGAIME